MAPRPRPQATMITIRWARLIPVRRGASPIHSLRRRQTPAVDSAMSYSHGFSAIGGTVRPDHDPSPLPLSAPAGLRRPIDRRLRAGGCGSRASVLGAEYPYEPDQARNASGPTPGIRRHRHPGVVSGISKSEVSRICPELDRDLESLRTRPLEGRPLRVRRRDLRQGPRRAGWFPGPSWLWRLERATGHWPDCGVGVGRSGPGRGHRPPARRRRPARPGPARPGPAFREAPRRRLRLIVPLQRIDRVHQLVDLPQDDADRRFEHI